MNRLTGLLLAAGLATMAGSSHGQSLIEAEATPENLQAVLEVLSRPETAKTMARFTKDYYDALLAAGFTQEQAIRILVGTGIPCFR